MISITDGQIYLQSNLFYQGQRPAVDVGISVSRVGGAAQLPAMKQVAGTLRLDLASYREMQAFAQFGSDLDDATQYQLTHGARMTEVLKQSRFSALDVVDQAAVLYAGKEGYLDQLTIEQVLPFRAALVKEMAGHLQLRDGIRAGKIAGKTEEELRSTIEWTLGAFLYADRPEDIDASALASAAAHPQQSKDKIKSSVVEGSASTVADATDPKRVG